MPTPQQLPISFPSLDLEQEDIITGAKWPANDLFPLNLNLENGNRTVSEVIRMDVWDSTAYLIITGFTSLNHLVSFLSEEVDWVKMQQVRILLGWEPKGRPRRKWAPFEVGREVKDYWLEKGFWLDQGGAVLRFTELLLNKKVEVRYYRHQHGKIYVGDTSAIMGSANFSGQGTNSQREANVRVMDMPHPPHPKLEDIRTIAENYYAQGTDFVPDLLKLLKQLMGIVDWPEALARAIAELLETQWYQQLPECAEKINSMKLWPCQYTGLTESLALLQQQHCVLIADPTGSGKTRMVAAIQAALLHCLWANGGSPNLHVQVVCPPAVRVKWEEELRKLAIFTKSASFGIISRKGSLEHKAVMENLRQARVLIIDEAHNFLNPNSNRSQQLTRHRADYVLLATATPINKSSNDLLRILELLDLDNLEKDQLDIFRNIYLTAKRGKLTERDRKQIYSFVQQFMVRRTKPLLRNLIAKEPEKYCNDNGERCAYPDLKQEIYETGETDKDQLLANEIEELARQLRGVLYLRHFESPKELNLSPEEYITRRVKLAPFLARYLLMSRLRSSRFALREHIIGTRQAVDDEDLESFKLNETGNVLQQLKDASGNKPNTRKLPNHAFEGNEWLINEQEYRNVCNEEIAIYEQILTKAAQISDRRDEAKARTLQKLVGKHSLLLAFDNVIGTLHYLHQKYLKPWGVKSLVVTGETPKQKALETFNLKSRAKNVVGLFSDALSEGVDLQKASGLVFLTIPGVIRLAEQRIGRIERLDSPHPSVSVYWPNDSDAFSLKTDKKLFLAAYDVASAIGSNFDPLEVLLDKHELSPAFELIKAHEAVHLLEQQRKEEEHNWEGLEDAFAPVRSLYMGKEAIISEAKYEQIRHTKAEVKVRIGLVKSEQPWLFLPTKGRPDAPPRWLFFDETDKLYHNLPEICAMLRTRLKGKPRSGEDWNVEAEVLLKKYRKQIEQLNFDLLPVKRKTAITVGEELAKKQLLKCKEPQLRQALNLIKNLSRISSQEGDYYLDFYALSQSWLDLLQDRLLALRDKRGRRKVTTLADIVTAPTVPAFTFEELKRFQSKLVQTTDRPFEIAACILGRPV